MAGLDHGNSRESSSEPVGDSAGPHDRTRKGASKRIGVLFVHGIGVQKKGDTLRDFGDPLLNWAGAWIKGHGGTAELVGCKCRDTDPTAERPNHQHARWQPREEKTGIELVVAESWWSEKFPTPSASQLAPWLPALVWSVTWRALIWIAVFISTVVFAANLIDRSAGGYAFLPAIFAGLAAVAVIFLMPPALLVLSWIPYVQKHASAALDFLLQWVGDALVYEQRPIETHAVEEKIEKDLHWLMDEPWGGSRADGIVIGAHSLGSLLVAAPIARTGDLDHAALVTFGSAIRLIKRHTRRFTSELAGKHHDLLWLNLYDPVDFISGYIKGRRKRKDTESPFPLNFKIDNCRSAITSHGCYPDNAEQFQSAFYRVILNRADASEARKNTDQALEKAIRQRFWRSRASSVLSAVSIPGGMAAALLLFSAGWPAWLADQASRYGAVPAPLKPWLESGPSSQGSAVAVSFVTAGAAVLAYLWICQLAIRRMEALSSAALAGKQRPTHRWRYWGLLLALFLLPVAAALTAGTRSSEGGGDNTYDSSTFRWAVLLALGPAVLFEIWILLARRARRVSLDTGQAGDIDAAARESAIQMGSEFAYLATPNIRGWKRHFPGHLSGSESSLPDRSGTQTPGGSM